MRKRDYIIEVEINADTTQEWQLSDGTICTPSRAHTVTVNASNEQEAINAMRSNIAGYNGKILSITTK